jgi:hypothetical protein
VKLTTHLHRVSRLRISGVDRYCSHTLRSMDWEGVYRVTCVHFSAVTRAGLFMQKKEEMIMVMTMMMLKV